MKDLGQIYAERDIMQLDIDGNYYARHVQGMTKENLHSKSDIAAELGWRDYKIDLLQQKLSDAQKALDGEIALSEFRRNQLVQLQSQQKQEPVHWRAIISDADKERQPDLKRHIVGFTTFYDAEGWAASERDFGGWSYNIEPLYLHPEPPQAACIPDGYKLVALEPSQHQLHEAYDNHLMDHFSRQSTGHELAKRIYKTMLSAAPKPEEL